MSSNDKDKRKNDQPYSFPKEEDKDDGASNGSSTPQWAPTKETEKQAPPKSDPQKN